MRTELAHQENSARDRVKDRSESRARKRRLLAEPGGLAKADDPARVATRIDRLCRYHSELDPAASGELVAEEPDALERAGKILEKIINSDDLLSIGYLEGGVAAGRSVARISVRDANGRLTSYGTGFLVSPRLLLSNHHVLPDRDSCVSTLVEFFYEDNLDGTPKRPLEYRLDPDAFFLANEELDSALVAVRGPEHDLAALGYNRLVAGEGKAIVGDFVSIIQHPGGEKKQVAVRENRVIDLAERFIFYETDTEPGSSGSPVFNDQWEVIALHHASVPAPERPEHGGILNEGVRVSRLVEFLTSQELAPEQKRLLDEVTNQEPLPPPPGPTAEPAQSQGAAVPSSSTRSIPPVAEGLVSSRRESVRIEIPMEVVVQPVVVDGHASQTSPESIVIDPDYSNRAGYDAGFLGEFEVALPMLPDDLMEITAVNQTDISEPRHVLRYHHFSVVMNKERMLPFFTAVNIDGGTSWRGELTRDSDRWFFDPRISRDDQAGEEIYRANPLDRGHLVRRLDPAWGDTEEVARAANDDTFHFTNCAPQHQDFNRNRTTWAGLEDYVLVNADNRDFKATVFTGPVFADDDDEYRGIRLPRQYWKIAVMAKADGSLSATAYLLSQEELIRGLESALVEFNYGAYKTYQVPLTTVEEMSRLDFGSLREADPLGQLEAAVSLREVRRPQEMIL